MYDIVNHHGHSVASILAEAHGTELYQIGIPDTENLLGGTESDDANVVAACLAANTDVNGTCFFFLAGAKISFSFSVGQ